MNKKQNGRISSSPLWLSTLLVVMLILCFILLTPGISSSVLPLRRDNLIKEFTLQLVQKRLLDPQEYWKFREFYSPGYFDYNKKGLSDSLRSQFITTIGIPTSLSSGSVFLIYHSPKLSSVDLLVNKQDLRTIMNPNFTPKHVIYQDTSTLMYEEQESYKLIFIKPITQMRTAVGFFDYDAGDKNLLDGKAWLNLTEIKK